LISIKAAEINFRYWHAWSPQGNDRVGYYMTVLGNIISTIFGHAGAKPAPTSPGTGPAAPQPAVDIEAVLTKLAGQNKEKLDWRRSIVDLLKLLELDSGLSARKELAKELRYTGDTNDSAAMNVWLHKQVMIKLAENGGKVPDSLKV
jgi:hypothetical protein